MENLYFEGFTQNRELSLLRFNERILEEACDSSVPLLERLRYLSIFSSNLDEFFMVRVGALIDEYEDDSNTVDEMSGLSRDGQLEKINIFALRLLERKDEIYSNLMDELREAGIDKAEYCDLNPYEKRIADWFWEERVKPLIREKIIEADDFNSIASLQNNVSYIIGSIRSEKDNKFILARIPKEIPSIVVLNDGLMSPHRFRYILLETLIKNKLQDIVFPFCITEKMTFKLTRSAEVSLNESGNKIKDMRDAITKRRLMDADRVVLDNKPSQTLSDFILDALNLNDSQLYITKRASFDFVDDLIDSVKEPIRDALLFKPFKARNILDKLRLPIIDTIKTQDILLSYPYDSMDPFIKLIQEAAHDERVTEIRITIYRLSRNSKIAENLIKAAKNGKKVKILIELRARFDEENNIGWAERFRKAGCDVYFGNEDFKVHSKIFQIVLREGGKETYITQISTGNFNEKTARIYTDLALMTCNQDIGEDADILFRKIIKGKSCKCMMLATSPDTLFNTLVMYIKREARKGDRGRIFIKCNSINEARLMEELMIASNAGCKIFLLVRGVCCILPGIEGCTENVVVKSIVGRFLEHSRVYIFGSGEDEVIYISSADLMKRNMHKRIEVACPILSQPLKNRIRQIMYTNANDNVKGRLMNSDGTYSRPKILDESGDIVDSQQIFLDY